MWYSQCGEDLFVWLNFINQKCEDGICVEMGGNDGISHSNSYYFEKELGFHTILIEPDKFAFKKMIKNRPKSICFNTAVSNSDEPFLEFMGFGFTGGLRESMATANIEKFHKRQIIHKVYNTKMSNILNKVKAPYIDYFSLDVEGGELGVLESIDWKNISIYLFSIELDGHNEEKDEKVRDILRNNGFIYKHRVHSDEYWINPNYPRKERLYDASKRPEYNADKFDAFGEQLHTPPDIRDKIANEIASYIP